MKTIGMLGGTGWTSTISYYTLINQLVHERLRGYHSAQILLKSVDYHTIMCHYEKEDTVVADTLKRELRELVSLKPDCLLICCNSLHKYYDLIKDDLKISIPLFHALELAAEHASAERYNKVLLLATKFTMEDGFFQKILEKQGIQVVIPKRAERHAMRHIHQELMQNLVKQESIEYFSDLINAYKGLDAVILGCTEYPMVVDQNSSVLPIIDPMYLQALACVEYVLE
jgi:aspartate racemase